MSEQANGAISARLGMDPSFLAVLASMTSREVKDMRKAALASIGKGSVDAKPSHTSVVLGTGTAALGVAGERVPAAVQEVLVSKQASRLASGIDHGAVRMEAEALRKSREDKQARDLKASAKKAAKAPKHTEPFQDSRGYWRRVDGRMMGLDERARTENLNPGEVKYAEGLAVRYSTVQGPGCAPGVKLDEYAAHEQALADTLAAMRSGTKVSVTKSGSAKASAGPKEYLTHSDKTGMWYFRYAIAGSKGKSLDEVLGLLDARAASGREPAWFMERYDAMRGALLKAA